MPVSLVEGLDKGFELITYTCIAKILSKDYSGWWLLTHEVNWKVDNEPWEANK